MPKYKVTYPNIILVEVGVTLEFLWKNSKVNNFCSIGSKICKVANYTQPHRGIFDGIKSARSGLMVWEGSDVITNF